MSPRRIAVLLSGRGSNFEAIRGGCVSGTIDGEVVAVISNRPDAPALSRAREWMIPAFAVDNKQCSSREAHEAEVLKILREHRPDFVALAGYMRLLSAAFVAEFEHRILNIHPSLLPSFPGVDAQAQAVAFGVKISGCTVHFVDESLDAGPIIIQRCIPVLDGDDAASLSARILEQEHSAYVEALARLSREPYRVEGRRVVWGEGGSSPGRASS